MVNWLGLAIAAMLATGAQAQSGADRSEARDGEFGGKMLITDDPEGFWREWEQPDTPTVTTTSRVTLSRPAHAVIVFHDCTAGSNGKCDVVVRFEIRKPDGKLYDKPLDGKAWSEAPAPGHNLLASLATFGFQLEPQDPLGRYQISATLTDRVAGKSISLSQEVIAEKDSSEAVPVS